MSKAVDDDTVFVAVGKDVEESRKNLVWALRHLQLRKIHLLLVRLPTELTPSSSGLEESEVNEILQVEWNSARESYYEICHSEGVNEQNICASFIPKGHVTRGIMERIREYGIRKLVVGTAPDDCYHEGMVHITSRKAKYLRRNAPRDCNIWFVCNGKLTQGGGGQFDRHGPSHSSAFTDHAEESWSQRISRQLEPISEAGKTANEAVEMVKEFEKMFSLGLERWEKGRLKLQKEREEHEKTKLERDEARSSFREAKKWYKSELKRSQKVEKELREKIEAIGQIKMEPTSSSLPRLGPDEPPPYFICPITRGIMRDPVVAADGYTYEAAEIRRWLRTGETSPMTGLALENQNLVPNLPLRSAIMEWLPQHPDFVDSP